MRLWVYSINGLVKVMLYCYPLYCQQHKQPPPSQSSAIQPAIQQSSGQKAAVRTYQDLLQNSADEASFRRYATAQLQLVPITADNSSGRLLGQPGIFSEFSLSPDGQLLLVKKLQQPFSYQVPYDAFPTSVEVWDLNGKLLKKLAQIPLQDKLPQGFDAVITGPREHSWRADAPATVVYAEAQDGGDMAAKVQIHDKVYSWAGPIHRTTTTTADTGDALSGHLLGQ